MRFSCCQNYRLVLFFAPFHWPHGFVPFVVCERVCFSLYFFFHSHRHVKSKFVAAFFFLLSFDLYLQCSCMKFLSDYMRPPHHPSEQCSEPLLLLSSGWIFVCAERKITDTMCSIYTETIFVLLWMVILCDLSEGVLEILKQFDRLLSLDLNHMAHN